MHLTRLTDYVRPSALLGSISKFASTGNKYIGITYWIGL